MSKVLISGAGIAGCCLAWWLHRSGYDVTVVERARGFRRGGYVIDFWGPGYDVAERMGIIDALKPQDLAIEQLEIVDARGKRVSGLSQQSLRELTKGRLLSIPRSALAAALYNAIADHVEVRFGDTIVAMEQTASGVDVRFEHGPVTTYDLVFGADGLHSAVRRLCFGAEATFEHYLGFYAAAFTAKGYVHREPHAYVMHAMPRRAMARITLKDDACVFLLLFAQKRPLYIAADDIASQKFKLRRIFAKAGWEAEEMLGALDQADDLYFDRMSQIEMPQWSHGRVALLGDACGCPSLLAGEGSSMAMVGAYSLAGELRAAAGNPVQAFRAYEDRLAPFVHRKQKAARGFATALIPTSPLGLWLRDTSLNLINGLGLSRWAFRSQLGDEIAVPDYFPETIETSF